LGESVAFIQLARRLKTAATVVVAGGLRVIYTVRERPFIPRKEIPP
jgi:hypothetical protein